MLSVCERELPIGTAGLNNSGLWKESPSYRNDSFGRWHSCDYTTIAHRCDRLHRHIDKGCTAASEQTKRRIARNDCADRDRAARSDHVVTPAASAELISVTPRCHFRPLRASHAHELEALAHTRQAYVIRRHAERRAAKESLALLNRLPAFFQRREIPALARPTDDPQPALLLIEREAASDGKMFDYLVRAEVVVTEEAG